MLSQIRSRIMREISYFKLLSPDARRMLLSYVLYLAAFPIITTFINAYLWRSGSNIWQIILYNLGYFIGLPLGFYFNGLLIKHFHMLRIYFFGAILQGIIPCLVVFIPFVSLISICAYGIIYGLGAGLYWGNKNYLDQQISRGTYRLYYNSLGQISDTLVNILIPLCVGWFIVLLTILYPSVSFVAYKIVMPVGFILLFLSGYIMQSSAIQNITITGMGITHVSRLWQRVRLYNILYNTHMGLTVITSGVLILILVGGEGILGTLQTITGIISACVLYIIGRKSSAASAWKFIGIGSVVFVIGNAMLAGMFTWVGAVIYTLVSSIVYMFQWSSGYSVLMDAMDHEESNVQKQYGYICDNEVFFNIGRTISIVIIAVLVATTNERTALQWSPFIIAILGLPLSFVVFWISKRIHRPAQSPAS